MVLVDLFLLKIANMQTTRPQELEIFENIIWHFQSAELVKWDHPNSKKIADTLKFSFPLTILFSKVSEESSGKD